MEHHIAIIGVGQSKFVRSYPGSIRELAFEGFKGAISDANVKPGDIDASVVCSAPEYDKQRSPSGIFAEYLGLNPGPTFYVETLCSSSSTGLMMSWPFSVFRRCRKFHRRSPRNAWGAAPTSSGKAPLER